MRPHGLSILCLTLLGASQALAQTSQPASAPTAPEPAASQPAPTSQPVAPAPKPLPAALTDAELDKDVGPYGAGFSVKRPMLSQFNLSIGGHLKLDVIYDDQQIKSS